MLVKILKCVIISIVSIVIIINMYIIESEYEYSMRCDNGDI